MENDRHARVTYMPDCDSVRITMGIRSVTVTTPQALWNVLQSGVPGEQPCAGVKPAEYQTVEEFVAAGGEIAQYKPVQANGVAYREIADLELEL